MTFEALQAHIGETLRVRRSLLGLDQASLSEISGVSRHTVSNVESGKGNPTLSVVFELCDALGLSISFETRQTEGSE